MISYSEEVLTAFKNNTPVVALESTIITHGMQFPQNFDTAISLEKILRDKGVVPATIAILAGKIVYFLILGKIHVGLSQD